MPLETSSGFITSKNVNLTWTGTGGVICTNGKKSKVIICALQRDQLYMLKYISSHKIGVSVEGPVHQFIMDEVLSSDRDHPDSQEDAPDDDAPVHGDQHCA